MVGWILPDPWPIPPTLTVRPSISISISAVLGTVSVVIIARAASMPRSGLSEPHAAVMPALTASIGRERPITPVVPTTPPAGAKAGRLGGTLAHCHAAFKHLAPPDARALARA